MQKIRLGNLDVYSPKRCVDWRVSVNIEAPGKFFPNRKLFIFMYFCEWSFFLTLVSVQQPVGTALFTRRKDRLSYSHEEFVIDLTQVTQASGPVSTFFLSIVLLS